MKRLSYIVLTVLFGGMSCMLSSCGDFLDQESDRVIDANKNHLNNASDTLYSAIGVMNKMQALADRTILLGELRGDLVDVNNYTSSSLRDIANFNVASDNPYNSPRDYYAVINNCNYFIANADTALKNNRNEKIFLKEYAAIKAYRAWTYLQLALNYGEVPFVTEPILNKDGADKQYEKKGIKEICDYFIDDIAKLADVEKPSYGTIRNNDSKLFFFPIYVLLGDLNLWAGHYREAALNYYKYIANRNGSNSSYPIGVNTVAWQQSDTKWTRYSDRWSNVFSTENTNANTELIAEIPGDSIPSEGNYSQLRNYFNSTSDNDYKVSIVASQALKNLSQAQQYCQLNSSNEVVYVPNTLSGNMGGDLRLASVYNEDAFSHSNSSVATSISNKKYVTRNIHIYRRSMVYLRMAEALNRAGFPRFAFAILKTGVNNTVLEEDILPYYPEEEAFLKQFDFPTNRYKLRTKAENADENTMGIHSHGSGWSDLNEQYVYPAKETEAEEEEAVEDLIINEDGLEFAFEGTRFYDLMRVALRRNDPSYLADRIYDRRGTDHTAEMKSLIGVDLNNKANWYLNWNGQLGLNNQ